MTETITRDRAAELLNQVCDAEPNRTDAHQMYFEEGGNNACLCVVGAVLEKLGKGLNDLDTDYGVGPDDNPALVANSSIFESVFVDGLEFDDDARHLLDEARCLNDAGTRWGTIPAMLGIVGVTVAGDEPEQEIES